MRGILLLSMVFEQFVNLHCSLGLCESEAESPEWGGVEEDSILVEGEQGSCA